MKWYELFVPEENWNEVEEFLHSEKVQFDENDMRETTHFLSLYLTEEKRTEIDEYLEGKGFEKIQEV